jgi:hypothetical protein
LEKVQINHNASSTTAIMLAIASSAIAAHVAGARVVARRRVPGPRRGHLPLFHQEGDGASCIKTREFDATRRRIRRVRLRRQG